MIVIEDGNSFVCRVSWSKRLAPYQIEKPRDKFSGTGDMYLNVKSAPQILACPYFSGMSTICSEIQYTALQ